jgi:phosphotransferase system  glucose/maltose/N-acetylglucosamine-specific IIC component
LLIFLLLLTVWTIDRPSLKCTFITWGNTKVDTFLMYGSYYGTIAAIAVSAVFLFNKAQSIKMKNKSLSNFIFCLGLNILTAPIAFFIGGMATDSPESNYFDFFKGFLFIQMIPLILLIISGLMLLIYKKQKKA